jgi:hypothetical protein
MEEEFSESTGSSRKHFPASVTNVKVQKAFLAPQLHRIPVFAPPTTTETNTRTASPPNPASPTNDARCPSRPPGGKVVTKSINIGGGKRNVNLENRMLVKMATVLPDDHPTEVKQGRLPESRAHLMKVHAELDDMMKDIRALDAQSSKFSFVRSMDDSFSNEIAHVTTENGNILYDVIIADLSSQAFRKVLRIKNFYQHYLVGLKNEHRDEIHLLKYQIQQLKSLLHEQQTYGSIQSASSSLYESSELHSSPHSTSSPPKPAPPSSSSSTRHVPHSNISSTKQQPTTTGSSSSPITIPFDNSAESALDLLSSDNIKSYIFQRLDAERKVKNRVFSSVFVD